jgi:hypothetical protein
MSSFKISPSIPYVIHIAGEEGIFLTIVCAGDDYFNEGILKKRKLCQVLVDIEAFVDHSIP